MASPVRKQEEANAGTWLAFSFLLVWGLAHGMVPLKLRTGPLSSGNLFWRHHHRHIQECVSTVTKTSHADDEGWASQDGTGFCSCCRIALYTKETNPTANTQMFWGQVIVTLASRVPLMGMKLTSLQLPWASKRLKSLTLFQWIPCVLGWGQRIQRRVRNYTRQVPRWEDWERRWKFLEVV